MFMEILLFLVLFALFANTVTVSPNHWIDHLRQNHAQMQKLLKKKNYPHLETVFWIVFISSSGMLPFQ